MQPQRILVVMLAPIGDTLFMTPTVHALRERYPEARLTGLAYRTNSGILTGNADLDDLIIWPTRAEWGGPRQFLRFLLRLRAQRFDTIIEFTNFLLWLCLLVGATKRVRFAPPYFWWIWPRQDDWKQKHAARHYANVVLPLGIEVEDLTPILPILPDERHSANAFLERHGVQPDDILIGIHPGGEGFRGMKQWPRNRFVSVANLLARRYHARIVLLGGKQDQDAAAAIAAGTSATTVLAAGHTSLKETAAIVERCALFIGNDSSPLHIASAVGTPAVGIYGPTNPGNFHPLGRNWAAVTGPQPLPCQPCFHFIGAHPLWQNSFFCQRPACLEQVTILRVVAAADKLLAAKGHRLVRQPLPLITRHTVVS